MGFIKTKLGLTDGSIIRKDDVCTIRKLESMSTLSLLRTLLHPGKETSYHMHLGEEIYLFTLGSGKMEIGTNTLFDVHPGDMILVQPHTYHRVINDSKSPLVFNCIIQKDFLNGVQHKK